MSAVSNSKKGRLMPLHADRLRTLRERLGLKQQEFAARTHISISQYRRYEYHQSDISGSHLIQIARELNCSADYLLGLVEEPGSYYSGRNLTPLEERWLIALHGQDTDAVVKCFFQRGAELLYEKLGQASNEDATIPLPKPKKGLTTGER